jgi:hypothetical protein
MALYFIIVFSSGSDALPDSIHFFQYCKCTDTPNNIALENRSSIKKKQQQLQTGFYLIKTSSSCGQTTPEVQ